MEKTGLTASQINALAIQDVARRINNGEKSLIPQLDTLIRVSKLLASDESASKKPAQVQTDKLTF